MSINILEQLTNPKPSLRTRLVFGLSRTIFSRALGGKTISDAQIDHAIAVAFFWHYFDSASLSSMSQKSYTSLRNDIVEILHLLQSGAIDVNILNMWPRADEVTPEVLEGGE